MITAMDQTTAWTDMSSDRLDGGGTLLVGPWEGCDTVEMVLNGDICAERTFVADDTTDLFCLPGL